MHTEKNVKKKHGHFLLPIGPPKGPGVPNEEAIMPTKSTTDFIILSFA